MPVVILAIDEELRFLAGFSDFVAVEETAQAVGFLHIVIVAFVELAEVFACVGDGLRAGEAALALLEEVGYVVAEEVGFVVGDEGCEGGEFD
jgi:hypothetical protein